MEEENLRRGCSEMSKIEMGKTYRTRDGREVRIYAVDGESRYPVHGAYKTDTGHFRSWAWSIEGTTQPGGCVAHYLDLIEVKPRIRREVWVNVYPDGPGYPTKNEADRHAGIERLACIPLTIDCAEGDGL